MQYKPILFLSIVLFLVLISIEFQKNPFPNTDYNQVDLYSDVLIEGGGLKYSNELNEISKYPIFGIRGLIGFDDSTSLAPSALPGIIVVYALFKGIDKPMVYLINPIFIVLSLFFFYLILKKFIFEKDLFIFICMVFASLSGVFIVISTTPFRNIVATAFFLAALYYAFKIIENNSSKDLFIFSILIGAGIILDYPSIIFIIPPVIYGLYKWRRKLFNVKKILIFSVPFFIVIFSLIHTQLVYLGGLLNFNSPAHVLNYVDPTANPRGIMSFVLNFDILKLANNFLDQILFLAPGILVFFFAGTLYFFKGSDKNKPYIAILLSIILLQFLFFLPKTWSGEGITGSAGTSYSRYLVVSWLFIYTITVLALSKLVHNKKVISIIILLTITLGIFTGIFTKLAINDLRDASDWSKNFKEKLIQVTPEKSVILTGFSDKYIYPIRTVGIYPAIPLEERMLETLRVSKELCAQGYSVYFIKENAPYPLDFSFEEYQDFFSENNMEFKQEYERLYKINCSASS